MLHLEEYEMVSETIFHLFNMIVLNSYILNKKFGKKMQKQDFIEYIASYLVQTSYEGVACLPQCNITSNPCPSRLVEDISQNEFPIVEMVTYVEHVTSQKISL